MQNNIFNFTLNGVNSLKCDEFGNFLIGFIVYRGFIESFITNTLARLSPYLKIKWSALLHRLCHRMYYIHLYDSDGIYMGCTGFYILSDRGDFPLDHEWIDWIRDDITIYCQNWMVAKHPSSSYFTMRIDQKEGSDFEDSLYVR